MAMTLLMVFLNRFGFISRPGFFKFCKRLGARRVNANSSLPFRQRHAKDRALFFGPSILHSEFRNPHLQIRLLDSWVPYKIPLTSWICFPNAVFRNPHSMNSLLRPKPPASSLSPVVTIVTFHLFRFIFLPFSS
jgi:hypothetical protein